MLRRRRPTTGPKGLFRRLEECCGASFRFCQMLGHRCAVFTSPLFSCACSNALQFAKQKPKSQFHYRNKADRPVSSPRSTGSAGSTNVDMLMLSVPVPQQVRTMKAPQVDAPTRFGNSLMRFSLRHRHTACSRSSSEGRPNSAPSEVQSHDAEDQVIRFVNVKTADKRKPARKNRGPRGRGRGLRRFRIPKSVKQALSNEIL